MNELFGGRIIPLYHKDILAEYNEVLRRGKFHLQEATIRFVLDSVIQFGIEVFPRPTGEILTDMDDLIFYKVRISQSEIREGPLGDEVVMEKRDDDAYLVTGNQKHYPIRDFIVTPSANFRSDIGLRRSTEHVLSLPVTPSVNSLSEIGPGRDTELDLIPPATPGLQGTRNHHKRNRLYTTIFGLQSRKRT